MGLMVDQVPVKWWDAGKALEEGSRARLYSAESQKINDLAAGENAARPDLPAAIGGDAAAIGRVAQASPSMLGRIAPMLQRLDTHNANKLKADADWTVGTSQAILSAPPEQRAGLWAAARADAQKRGIATDLPEQYDENRVKFYRDRAVPVKTWFEEQEKMRRHTTPGARATGGDGFDPLPNAPAAAPPGRGASAGPLPGDAPAPVFADASGPTPPGTFAPPDVARATQPGQAPQTASAGPPVGPQGNPILSLPGRASASVGADMPTFGGPSAPFPASGAPSLGPVPQEGAAGPAGSAGPAAGPPPGFQAMGHRTPDGQLVPALINGQPVFRNPQTGEMTLGGGNTPAPAAGPDVQLAQATPPQGRAPATPSAPPVGPSPNLPAGAAGVEGLPPGWVQRTKNGVPVIKDGYFYATNPQTGQTVPYKPTERALPPAGYEHDPVAPGRLRPIPGGPNDKSGPEIDPTLKGPDLLAALDPYKASQVQAVVEGRLQLPKLTSRMAEDAKELRKLAFQYEPGFDDTVFASRQAMQKDLSTGKLATNRTSLNTMINHMAELHDLGQEINNSPVPLVNKVGNWIQGQEGDPRIAKFEIAKHLVAEEAGKFFRGSGGVTNAEVEEMQKRINSAQSPAQMQGVLTTISHLMRGRMVEMTNQINSGMKYPEDKKLGPDALLSDDAKKSLTAIMAPNPNAPATVGGKLTNAPPTPANPSLPAGVPPPPPGFRIIQP